MSPASWKCSEEFFSRQIRSRDPLKLGFPNVWALRLVRDLLRWDPGDRLSVDDALRHPYFQPHKSVALSIRLDPPPTKSDVRGTFSNSMSEDERGSKTVKVSVDI
ncbi:hypothetical protein Gogos_009856, partial [Gossypium gossypioides]|nr:hypothetical protein [Gossypium gossypioides]